MQSTSASQSTGCSGELVALRVTRLIYELRWRWKKGAKQERGAKKAAEPAGSEEEEMIKAVKPKNKAYLALVRTPFCQRRLLRCSLTGNLPQ